MPSHLLTEVSISGSLHHQLKHHINVSGQAANQREEEAAGGAGAPGDLVGIADEADAFGPEDIVTEKVQRTVDVGRSEAQAQNPVGELQGSFGSLNGIYRVPQSEH